MTLAPDRLQRAVDDDRVLADVEAGGAETEGLDLPAHGPHVAAGERAAARTGEAGFEREEVGDELIGIDVADGGRLLTFAGGERRVELTQHAGEELAEDLARIAGFEGGALAAGFELGAQALEEHRRHGGAVGGDAQRAQQAVELAAVAAQDGEPAGAKRIAGDRVGDEGVAVAVAADPRAE